MPTDKREVMYIQADTYIDLLRDMRRAVKHLAVEGFSEERFDEYNKCYCLLYMAIFKEPMSIEDMCHIDDIVYNPEDYKDEGDA